MSLREKQEDIEQTLEAKTGEVERHERNISEIESRLQKIESAISGTLEDRELCNKLENNLNERQRELHDEERNAEILRNELDSLLSLVTEGEKTNAESVAALDDLRSLGEDIEDAEKIIKEREAWATETKHTIADLMQRLDGQSKVQGESFVTSGNSKRPTPPDAANDKGMYSKKLGGVERGLPMPHEEASGAMAANPKFNAAKDRGGYQTNCQSCVVVHELRRRGYKVQTLPNRWPFSTLRELSFNTNKAWIDPSKTGKAKHRHPAYIEYKGHKVQGANEPASFITYLETTVGRQQERYTLEFSYSTEKRKRAGHIINVDRDDRGQLRLYDPQSGKEFIGNEQVVQYTTRMELEDIKHLPQILRIDNMAPNPDIVNFILKKSTR
jgi:hypothetical protein